MTVHEWNTADDWDNNQSEQGVTHEVYGDIPSAAELRLGWATSLPNLVHMWPMHDSSGPVTDVVGGNNGTINGVTLDHTPAPLGYTTGDFDGSDDDINLGSSTSLEGQNSHTILAFVQMDSNSSNDVVGSWGSDTADRAYLLMVYDGESNNGGVRAHVGDGSNISVVDSNQDIPTDGTWVMIGQRWDGSTLEAIIDGAVDDSTSAVSSITTSSNNTYIGNRRSRSGSFTDGRVGPVMFFDTAISDALLSEIWDVVNTSTTPNGLLKTGKKIS